MTVVDEIVKIVRDLPVEKQVEIRAFVKKLSATKEIPKPSFNWIGLCANDGIPISEEDIAEARREMWGCFPRDIG